MMQHSDIPAIIPCVTTPRQKAVFKICWIELDRACMDGLTDDGQPKPELFEGVKQALAACLRRFPGDRAVVECAAKTFHRIIFRLLAMEVP